MTPEEGLEGCWFSATIQQLGGGWALVAYAELKESAEEGSPPLREWFPVPGQAQAAAPPRANPAADCELPSAVEGGKLRPAPPAEVRKVACSAWTRSCRCFLAVVAPQCRLSCSLLWVHAQPLFQLLFLAVGACSTPCTPLRLLHALLFAGGGGGAAMQCGRHCRLLHQ